MKKLILAVLLSLSSFAFADISRNCHATLEVFITDGAANPRATLADITGKGSCQNVLYANQCRKNARVAINGCLSGTWLNRSNNTVHEACKSLVSASSRSGARLTWSSDLDVEMTNHLLVRSAFLACCHLRPSATAIELEIGGRITGDKGCAAHKIGNNRYQEEVSIGETQVNCAALRQRGLCQ